MDCDFSLSPLIDLPSDDSFLEGPKYISPDLELTPSVVWRGHPTDFPSPTKAKIISILKQDPMRLDDNQAYALSDRIILHIDGLRSTFKVKGLPKQKSPTFWVELDSSTHMQKVQINIPGNILGSGSYKKIKGGLEIALPGFEVERYVRWRARAKDNQDIMVSAALHKKIYDLVHDPQNKIRIASPPRIRRTERAQASGTVEEPIQKYYPYVLHKLVSNNQLLLEEKLEICYGIFCTIEAIHAQGYVFLDVKAANILVDTNFLPYLNDFDVCTNRVFHQKGEYVYWDIATKNGLANPYCDVVGAALTMLQVLFPQKYSLVERDIAHSIFFRDPKSLEHLSHVLEVDKSQDAQVLRKVVALAIHLVKAERQVYTHILASMRRYFNNDESCVEKWTFEQFKKCEVSLPDGMTFTELFETKKKRPRVKLLNSVVEILVNINSTRAKDKNSKFSLSVRGFYEKLTKAHKETLYDLAVQHRNITSLLSNKKEWEQMSPSNGSETLFKNLLSEDKSNRLEAFKELEKLAPSISSIKSELSALRALPNPRAIFYELQDKIIKNKGL